MSHQQHTVLVTGAAGHLGRAVAAMFRERGSRLVLVDREAEALEAAFGDWKQSLCIPIDLCDADKVRNGVAQAVEHFDRLDVLCHIAGGFRMGESVHATSPSTLKFLLDLNVGSFINVAGAVVPHFLERGGGKIVTVGAAAASRGVASMGAYCASKSALIRLTEAMSAELKHQNVNVNCVLPTILDTPDNRAAMPQEEPSTWVAPTALAEVIAFLASEASRAIHGAAIPVTGLVAS